ncbi:hypothetical protein [Anaerosinus massiliensis]|uniref:hypothetical protein n=1 Tax=Massilibacillus massiliensis TaxID=1806837 RepID=UPI0018FE2EE3|nr:hypothetical protein [Massilibacillus massiliensis]
MQNQQFSEEQLWQKYEILTEEMGKFLDQDDTDTFLELIDQRVFIEKQIIQLEDKVFIKTTKGKQLLKKMIELNKSLRPKCQRWLNQSRNQRNISRAYESLGFENSGFNWDKQF